MLNPKADPNFDAHEDVVFIADEKTGLAGVIAVHSTYRGPSAGGCRYKAYPSPKEALTDALRLSRGMSFKNAMANLPAGGGKAVIYAPQDPADRVVLFEAFGREVDKLGGRYITAEDVGVTVADMVAVSHSTKHVAGLPREGANEAGGDPSPWTALGVFLSIEATIGRPLKGARVAVQGLGAVGFKTAKMLHEAGARLVVADVNEAKVAQAVAELGAETAAVDAIHRVQADLFSPNALGAGLNPTTIPELGAPVVCGGANNQLATPADGMALLKRGVVYAPDYVVNAGGIISIIAEHNDQTVEVAEANIRAIPNRLLAVLDRARAEKRPTSEVADEIAMELIGRKVPRAA